MSQLNPTLTLGSVHVHLVSPSCPLPYLSRRYQRFLSDYEELSGWMKEKAALISADELPTDVASGEALLDRHRQHKVDRKSPPPPGGRKREGPGVPEGFLLHFKTFCLVATARDWLLRWAIPICRWDWSGSARCWSRSLWRSSGKGNPVEQWVEFWYIFSPT